MTRLNLIQLPAAPRLAATNFIAPRHTAAATPGLRHLLHNESGQDMIEYALVAALVGLGAVTALKGLKTSISTAFNGVGSTLTSSV